MDKQKIIKIAFMVLSVVLFFYLLTASTKRAYREVSEKANSSIQVFATNHAQLVFNAEVFRDYRNCKKRAKGNKKIKNYVEYCSAVLNEVSIPEDGYLTNVSRKYYSYNWFFETFSNKKGKFTYKMTKKDKYLSSNRCLFTFVSKILMAIGTSLLLSGLFYFAMVLLQRLTKILLKTTMGRVLTGVAVALFCCVYFAYKYSIEGGGGGTGLNLMNGDISLSTDIPVVLKIMITTMAGLIFYKEFKVNKIGLWTIGFLLIAIVFNPFIPIIQVFASIGIGGFVNTLSELFFVIYLIKEYKSFSSK